MSMKSSSPRYSSICSEGWPPFADRLLELARAAEPGSDHQLAYVDALCTSVLALRHVAVLAALLDTDPADQGLAGLTVDTTGGIASTVEQLTRASAQSP